MRRALLGVVALLAALFTPLVVFAVPAAAYCPPDGAPTTIYPISNKSFTYYPTNLHSAWVSFRNGGSITYSETSTLTMSASMTATVSAEAGIIFAKASTSLGVTVGGSYSKTKAWSYTANVPASTTYKYRLHAYHYSATFTVTKKTWSYAHCGYTTVSGWPQTVKHAPTENSNTVWRLDRALA